MSSFGEELRRERELREISLREISEATKISLRYLDALERNDFRHLPGGVFNKGFVRAYAQYIGVDPESMVNAYLLELKSQESLVPQGKEGAVARHAASVTDHAAPQSTGGMPRRMWSGIAVLAALLVVAVLLGYAVVRIWRSSGRSAQRTSVSLQAGEWCAIDPVAGDRA
jgi:cytoskeleton protein RodZ